uniref:Polyprenol reductase n=1 Tax=Mesocestoides corti TaxID=53468 RepID=A0A5K3FXQ2_MESCO
MRIPPDRVSRTPRPQAVLLWLFLLVLCTYLVGRPLTRLAPTLQRRGTDQREMRTTRTRIYKDPAFPLMPEYIVTSFSLYCIYSHTLLCIYFPHCRLNSSALVVVCALTSLPTLFIGNHINQAPLRAHPRTPWLRYLVNSCLWH